MNDDFDIPEFLRRKPGDKSANVASDKKLPPPVDPVAERQKEFHRKHAEQKKQKARERIAKLKHEKGVWDPKQKRWVSG